MEWDFAERARRFRKAREDNNESLREVEANTDVKKTTIYKLEKAEDETNVGYQDIVKLANHYKVNVAWLMQQPGSSAPLDENIQNAIKVTGLSSEAVEQLCSFGADEIACLNALLTSYDFRKALMMIASAQKISEQNEQDDETAEMIERANLFRIDHQKDKNAWYKIENPNEISNRQLIRMYRNEALQDIGNVLREIAPADEEERKGK